MTYYIAMKVYVAMSGGVDSSVAALLLQRDGHDITGVFMKPWQPSGHSCMWEQERADAVRVAAMLNIPIETWDFSREYARHISGPMVRSYRNGLTPNPDIECNRHIKFGYFARRAFREGAQLIATGHYARTHNGSLLKAHDRDKDQTYFLWAVSPVVLRKTLFPVGNLTKSQVRAIALGARLPVAAKKDSQGVCFVGDLDMKQFLSRRIRPRKGDIVDAQGRILGQHDGTAYYTIGQRHGLDIKDGGGPYYVVSKNTRANRITVGTENLLSCSSTTVMSLRWHGTAPSANARIMAKIRYRSPSVPVKLSGHHVRFLKPVKAVAPGQSIVFYEGVRIAGGAILS